jgi:hypothetical protein
LNFGLSLRRSICLPAPRPSLLNTGPPALENIRDAIREYLAAIKEHYRLQTFAKLKSPFNDAENSRR